MATRVEDEIESMRENIRNGFENAVTLLLRYAENIKAAAAGLTTADSDCARALGLAEGYTNAAKIVNTALNAMLPKRKVTEM